MLLIIIYNYQTKNYFKITKILPGKVWRRIHVIFFYAIHLFQPTAKTYMYLTNNKNDIQSITYWYCIYMIVAKYFLLNMRVNLEFWLKNSGILNVDILVFCKICKNFMNFHIQLNLTTFQNICFLFFRNFMELKITSSYIKIILKIFLFYLLF